MYDFEKQRGSYVLRVDGEELHTPMGMPVFTGSRELAKKLCEDLERFGEKPSNPLSLVAFHYAMIDFFSDMPRAETEYSVVFGLNKENDWTFNCPTAEPHAQMEWMGLFGTYSNNAEKGKEWLASLSLPQLCSVCIVGRAIESVNIPFIISTMLKAEIIYDFAEAVVARYPYFSKDEMGRLFDNYLFYFNLDEDEVLPGAP
jgi:hypothetical protein